MKIGKVIRIHEVEPEKVIKEPERVPIAKPDPIPEKVPVAP